MRYPLAWTIGWTTYIALFSLTDAGIKAAKDSPRRLDAAKKLLTDMGGEMKQFYIVMGDFDFVGICEVPDHAVMSRYFLQLGAFFVRIKTLKAFPETAYREIIRSLGWTSKPIEAECSTLRFRSDLRRVRVHRGRPLRASSVVGATDDCRNTVVGLIVAGACLAHRRSAKAKGLAVASHRAAATP
jgi:uncharacterized protein with GYD domain